MTQYLPIAQGVVSILLIISILLQKGSTSLGSSFGGGESGFYATKRGMQKKLFWTTVALGVLFMGLALLNHIL